MTQHLCQIGRFLYEKLNNIFIEYGIPAKMMGDYSMPIIAIDDNCNAKHFVESLYKSSVFLPVNDNIGLSLKHDESLIMDTVRKVEMICKESNNVFNHALPTTGSKVLSRKMIHKKWRTGTEGL